MVDLSRYGPYVPSIIPAEDREALAKYRSGRVDTHIGFGEKAALLVVDMSRAFVEDQYRTGWAKTGEPCARAIRQLLDVARPLGVPIFFTTGSPKPEAVLQGRNGKGVPPNPSSPLQNPKAHEIVDILAPQPGEILIVKPKPSAFFGTPLLSYLVFHRVDTVIVTGMVTAGCIRATVNDAFSYNYRAIVPIECVADRSQISHEVELFDMDMKYADVLPMEAVLEYFRTVGPPVYGRAPAQAGV